MFGLPVRLTHEGTLSYKTTIGSMFTVLLAITILAYSGLKLASFIKQDSGQSFKVYPLYRDL